MLFHRRRMKTDPALYLLSEDDFLLICVLQVVFLMFFVSIIGILINIGELKPSHYFYIGWKILYNVVGRASFSSSFLALLEYFRYKSLILLFYTFFLLLSLAILRLLSCLFSLFLLFSNFFILVDDLDASPYSFLTFLFLVFCVDYNFLYGV